VHQRGRQSDQAAVPVKAGGLVGHDPAIHRQSADRIITSRQRQYPRSILQFQAIDIVDPQFSADPVKNLAHPPHGLDALALRGAGDHAQPARRKAHECAIAQLAVVVLPTCRAVSAMIEAPSGARKNSACHGADSTPSLSRTHCTGSIR
jgi:hypothetical protein